MKYKKASDGQWPGYPHLQLNEIETMTIRQNEYIAKSMVNNRKGRIVLLMDTTFYQQFLAAVAERKGDISAANVNAAALDALKEWIKKNKKQAR